MKPKSIGPARTLSEFRQQHEAKGHRVFDDGLVHTWRIHRCGGCDFRFYILKENAKQGANASGEEWSWS